MKQAVKSILDSVEILLTPWTISWISRLFQQKPSKQKSSKPEMIYNMILFTVQSVVSNLSQQYFRFLLE